MRSNVTTPDVRLTSHIPCSDNLLSERGIVQSRNHRSEAAREQERCDLDKPGGAARCVGDLETPSDYFRQNALLLCVSHCINVSQSKRTVQGYEGFEKLFVQCIYNNHLWRCRVVKAKPCIT